MSDDGRSDRRPPVGDATLKRIDDIADGWKRPKQPGQDAKTAKDVASGTPAVSREKPSEKTAPKPSKTVPKPADTAGAKPADRAARPDDEPDNLAKSASPGFAARARRSPKPPAKPVGSKPDTASPGGKPAQARAQRKSEPPPPPGSPRRAKDSKPPAVATSKPRPAAEHRAKTPSDPPPPAGGRAKRTSAPPPPAGGRAKRTSAPPPLPPSMRSADDQQVIKLADVADPDDVQAAGKAAESGRARRRSRPPSAHPPAAAADARAQAAVRKAQRSTGSLRMPTEIPADRGPLGDMSYAITASLGARAAKRELIAIEIKLKSERDDRRERLIELGRQAIADPSLKMPVIDQARQQIVDIEDRRSRKAGRVAALDAELDAIESERKRRQDAQKKNVGAVEDDIAVVISELSPLEQHLATLRRRTGELKSEIRKLDSKIEKTEARLIEDKQPGDVPHEMEADIAGMRAERDALVREGPELAGKIADMEPEIAGLKASKAELETTREELKEGDQEATDRSREKIEAVTARKAVDDREVADVAKERELSLRELGAALHELRPEQLEPRLRGIDQHDEAITTLERRAIELKDKILRTDKKSIVRGFLYLFALGLVTAVIAVLILN